MLCISCFCSIFRKTSRLGKLHSRPKQCKHILDFSWNQSWNLLEICSVKFVDTLQMNDSLAVIVSLKEMACLSVFMQGSSSPRAYPFHYMDSTITTYLTICKWVHFQLPVEKHVVPWQFLTLKRSARYFAKKNCSFGLCTEWHTLLRERLCWALRYWRVNVCTRRPRLSSSGWLVR